MKYYKSKQGYKKLYKPKKKEEKDAGTKALRKIKKLEKEIEVKYHDTFSTQVVTNAGSIASLTDGITQGTGDGSYRIGDKLKMLNLFIRAQVEFPTTPGGIRGSAKFFRFIIFKDKLNRITNVNNLLPVPYVGTVNVITSNYLWDVKEEVKILYDKTWATQNDAADGQKSIKLKIPLQMVVSYFTALSTEVDKNAIRYIILSDEPALGTNAFFRIQTRITYRDL